VRYSQRSRRTLRTQPASARSASIGCLLEGAPRGAPRAHREKRLVAAAPGGRADHVPKVDQLDPKLRLAAGGSEASAARQRCAGHRSHPPLPSPANCRAATPKMEPISQPGITSWRRPCCRACRPGPHGEVGLAYAFAANLPPPPNLTLDPRPSRTDLALPLEEKAAPRSSNLQAGGRTHSWKLMYPAQGRFPLQGFYDFRTFLPVNLYKSMQERAHTLQPRNASLIGREKRNEDSDERDPSSQPVHRTNKHVQHNRKSAN